MKMKLLLTLIALVVSSQSGAVPLFGETAGTIKNGILTLYRDHQDPKKVYFFPNSTRFSVDQKNVPLFNFVFWGISAPAATPDGVGAYLTMSTHLDSDQNQKSALDSYMKEHPEIEVAVLPIKSSLVGLQTTDPAQAPLSVLFKEFNFAKVGGRAEDEIGINAVMTPIGAKAFKAMLLKSTGGSKLKFDYCYKIQGYGPNMDASIQVDMRRVYDYFEASHNGGWGWFSWDIKAVVEKLKDERTIQISMNGGDAKEWEYLDKIAGSITERLFRPELAASPVSTANGNRLFNFGVGSVHKEELKKETWVWTRRDLEEREFCTAIVLKDLEPYISNLVVDADQN